MVKTPTIKQLLAIQTQIESIEEKLGELRMKRSTMLDASRKLLKRDCTISVNKKPTSIP